MLYSKKLWKSISLLASFMAIAQWDESTWNLPPNCWARYWSPLAQTLYSDRYRWDADSWDWLAAVCDPCGHYSVGCSSWCGSGPCVDVQPPCKERARDYKSILWQRDDSTAGTWGYLLEDAPVHDKHHNAWYPEANRAGDERIGLVNHKCALIWTQWDLTQMLGRCIPAQKDGRKWDEGGQYPDIGKHKTDGSMCHIQWILQGTHYGIVSIQ